MIQVKSKNIFTAEELKEFLSGIETRIAFDKARGFTHDEAYTVAALQIMHFAHQSRMRKFNNQIPYSTHPLQVSHQFSDPKLIQLALLHDVLEDSNLTADHLRFLGFDEDVVEAAEFIEKRPGELYGDYLVRMSENELCRQVKHKDTLDNYFTPPYGPPTRKSIQKDMWYLLNAHYYDYVGKLPARQPSERVSLSQFLMDEDYGFLESLPTEQSETHTDDNNRFKLTQRDVLYLVSQGITEQNEPGLRAWLEKRNGSLHENARPYMILPEFELA